ncbi:hypothetical protein PT195_08830, partial [Erysipelothrix rhusiopathiae]|nr:hypothetical protein [Erysipelothrix rhusiopathiae]
EIKEEINNLIKNKEKSLPNLNLELPSWTKMTDKQQQIFIDKTVESIVIDMNLKVIREIVYFDENSIYK